MRIACVVHDYHRGGGHSRYVVELAERFCTEHEVHVFANRFETFGNRRIAFHPVSACRRTALSTILTFRRPTAAFRRGEFDIVHSQGICGWPFNVVTAHVCGAAWRLARITAGETLGWKDRVFHGLVDPLERDGYRRFAQAKVIAISKRVRRDLMSCYGAAEDATVIHHGVDTNQFSPAVSAQGRNEFCQQHRIPTSTTLALYAGDLRKAAAPLFESIAMTPDVTLICISRSGIEPYRNLAARFGITDRVRFLGAVEDIQRYYRAVDLFFFPSSYDAFGMVVTEAMASGLPVVVTAAAGASEMVRDGETGFVVDNPDAKTLSQRLRLLATNPDLCRQFGRAARQDAAAMSWDSVAGRTMQVYKQALRQ